MIENMNRLKWMPMTNETVSNELKCNLYVLKSNIIIICTWLPEKYEKVMVQLKYFVK